ncbi:unnamed protein product [Mytilus edulis]|uniref:Uncharacterized protein n=1 Tax=Mytilus edulis TaxID=6550 RepID=A0A8S3SC07_MYTED|nr:unnamed protein product [Mytilus edulis]
MGKQGYMSGPVRVRLFLVGIFHLTYDAIGVTLRIYDGGGSFAGFLTALGGKLTGQAFDLVIKEMGLETTFKKIHFSIPEGPKDCPVDINPQKYLPAAIRNMLTCEMPQNCFGLNCGLDLSFKLPFGDFHVSYNIPFWFKISPCDFDIDIKFGPFQHKTVLLNYDWGKYLNMPGSASFF